MSKIRYTAIPALAALLACGPALAQGMGRPSGPVVGTAEMPVKAPPPRALPGARTENGSAAPPDRVVSDMKPNEALFDAINRGDTPAAREAIGRGADPDARNILDLTPIDLAVDLGRNEITFLLLALRGSGSNSAAATRAAANAGAAPARGTGILPVAAPKRTAASSAPMAPRQMARASDPGVPAPQAGFLGFGGSALR